MKQQPMTSPSNKMNENHDSAWYRLTLSVVFAFVLVAFIQTALITLSPAAAGHVAEASTSTLSIVRNTAVFTITGTICQGNGQPVPYVQVFAFSGAGQAETITGSNGQYALTLTSGNSYDIVFNPPAGSNLASQARRGVSSTATLDVTLPPGHSIFGTVYRDATKTSPVANTAIFAFNRQTFEGFGLPPSKANGTYQISLEEGDWELTFTPPPFAQLGPTHSTVLTLSTDISKDIILQPGFTVYGKVDDGTGTGVSSVEIFALSLSQAAGFGFSPTGASGLYTGTLPSGIFDILFLAPPFRGLGSTVVTNVNGPPDIQHDLTLPAGYTVSGTVGCGGGLANAFVTAAPQPPLSAGIAGRWGKFADANGFYALALQPGTYTFTVTPPGATLNEIVLPMVAVNTDLTIDFPYPCTFLPAIFRN